MEPGSKKKVFWVVVTTIFGVALFFTLLLFFGPGSRPTIEIYVVPDDAKVTIDGKPTKAGEITVTRGKHTVAATRQYFGDAKQEFNTKDLPNNTVYLALFPNSEEGEAYLKRHPEEEARYERISGAEFSALQEKLLKDYPITQKLPYETLDYKIDYDVTASKNVVFVVKFYVPEALTPGTDAYRDYVLRLKSQALSYLSKEGIDTKKVSITYNPDPGKL